MFVKPKYFNVNICILLQSLIFNLLKLLTFCQLIRSVDSWWKSGWWLVRLPIGQFLHIQPVGCSISLIYSGNGESCAFVVNTWNWGHNYLWASCIGSVSLQIFFPQLLLNHRHVGSFTCFTWHISSCWICRETFWLCEKKKRLRKQQQQHQRGEQQIEKPCKMIAFRSRGGEVKMEWKRREWATVREG